MSVQTRIQQDMIQALKARDQERRNALSFLASELKRVAIDRRITELPDPDAIQILQKQLKLRHEAIQAAKDAGREELISQNEYEVGIIQSYLPKGLSADEMAQLAERVIAKLGATSMRDMGKVIAECTAEAPGVDKSQLSAVVKAKLSGK
jgi:uncharacterized protein YqeY